VSKNKVSKNKVENGLNVHNQLLHTLPTSKVLIHTVQICVLIFQGTWILVGVQNGYFASASWLGLATAALL